MERKKFTYVLEIIYNQFYNRLVEDKPNRGTEPAIMRYNYTDDNQSKAYNEAKKNFDKFRRVGIEFDAGSVKTLVLPSAILQIGIVNLDKYEEESKEMQAAQIEQEVESQADSTSAS
jgi:hypothetical protein